MKLEKLQTEILKSAMKKLLSDKDCTWGISYDEDEDVVYVTDNHLVIPIPGAKFLLDVDLVGELGKAIPLDTIKRIYNSVQYPIPAIRSTEIRKIGPHEAMKIISGNGDTSVWVDRKYLAYYEEDATFGISGQNKPVYIYEDNEVVGLVMGVKVED